MSMHPTTARTPPGHHDHDSIVRLHDVPWDEFEGLIAARGESPTPRVAYLAGELELVSPSRNHEAIKSMFGRLIEAWAEETGVDLQAYGSWLIKKKRARRGAEPDECYVVGLHTSAAPISSSRSRGLQAGSTSSRSTPRSGCARSGSGETARSPCTCFVLESTPKPRGARCCRRSTSMCSCAFSTSPTRPPRCGRTGGSCAKGPRRRRVARVTAGRRARRRRSPPRASRRA